MRLSALCALAVAASAAHGGLPQVDTAGIEPEPAAAGPQRWVHVTLDRDLPERRDPFNLFDPRAYNFRDLLDLLAGARGDEQVRGVVLAVDDPGLGWSRLQSLRRAIAALRAEDKEVIALLTEESTGGYLVATACDEIVMAPAGALMLTGLQLDGVFLRGLLDLVGIQPDIMQIGIYKGAGDMFTERAFTPALREAYTSLVDDLWAQMIAMIAEGRALDPAQVEALIDQGPFTAGAALAAGLVDSLTQREDFVRELEIASGDGFILDREYGEEDAAAPEFNIFNILQMMQAPAETAPSQSPKVALVYASGPILPGRATGGPFEDTDVIHADDFVDLLHECRDDATVRAVVIRLDSPGGSALASDMIWSEIRALRRAKPVVVSMGNLAASGGYYIAMAADEIFAEPATLTGSIGVVGGKFVLTGLLEGHLGITHDTLARGRNAGFSSPFTPFSPTERAALETLMREVYATFTRQAAESRGMTAEQIEAVAQGRLWTGRQAHANGLVDTLGGLEEALARAQDLAGLDEADRAQIEIRELPPPMNFFEWMSQYMAGSAGAALPATLARLLPAADLTAVAQAGVWQALMAEEQVMTLMPVVLSVR